MPKSDIPVPVCSTCGESCSKDYVKGETLHRCSNCGTEMKYMPAGELLNSGGRGVTENNGWIMSFSICSSELQSSRVMSILGILIVTIGLSFLWLGRIGMDAALWSIASGILITLIGLRRLTVYKKKTQETLDQYRYWNK